LLASPPLPSLQDAVKLTLTLGEPLMKLQAAARRVAERSQECKMEVDAGEGSQWGVGGRG
jgi:hypothetical protein